MDPAGKETLQPQQCPPLHSPLCKRQSGKQNKEVIRGMRTTHITHMYNYSNINPFKISINPASERSFTSGFQKKMLSTHYSWSRVWKKAWFQLCFGECVSL